MPKKFSIKAKIDAQLEADYNKPLTYTPAPAFRPSYLGTPCLRKVYYSYLRVQPDYPWEAKNVRIFQTGDSMHNLVKAWIRKIGCMIDYRNEKGEIPKNYFTKEPDPEFPINDKELELKGKIDGIGVVEGELWVFEIKSMKERYFDELRAPKDDHAQQAMSYAYLFEERLKAGAYQHIPELNGHTAIKGVIFLYINKNTSEMKEYQVPKDSEPFMTVIQKIVSVKEHIAAKKLPPKTEDFCPWCSFRDKCAREYKVT